MICRLCVEKRKTIKDYTCMLCALGLSMTSGNVVKDPFTGTVHIDLSGVLK